MAVCGMTVCRMAVCRMAVCGMTVCRMTVCRMTVCRMTVCRIDSQQYDKRIMVILKSGSRMTSSILAYFTAEPMTNKKLYGTLTPIINDVQDEESK